MAYNIESLIQRGNAQVSLNIVGGVLGVTVQTVNPQYPSQGTTDIDASLLRDIKATLSNNAMPSVGMCNVSIVDGAIMIVAPNNCPLIEGGNLVVISGVYLNTMFVWSVSVEGVTDGHLTADITVTLQDGDITGILSAIEPDIAAGKQELAAAISGKGVETSADAALSEMASNVGAIAQESYTIDGGEMYAKQLFGSLETPNYWNLYDVLANLLSDGRLVQYGGILLAEYYRGYDSLDLSGAGAGGAYVVSDKDENGQFKMYTEDTTHVWNTEFDGKGNRWVAYCFADEYHDFQITDTNTSPHNIFIGRKVGDITNLVNGRTVSVITPDGNTLRGLKCKGFPNNFQPELVLRNIEEISEQILYINKDYSSIYISVGTISGNIIGKDGSNRTISSMIVKADSITKFVYGVGANFPMTITSLIIDCANITSDFLFFLAQNENSNTSIPSIRILTEYMHFTNRFSYKWANLLRVYLGYKTNDKSLSVDFGVYDLECSHFNDIELQEGWCKPLSVHVATTLTEANMYAHILQRLKQDEADCGDGVTITLGATNLAKLTSEESVQLLDDLTNIYGYTFA